MTTASINLTIREADEAYIAYRARENWRCTRLLTCRRPVTHILHTPGANPALTGICTKHAEQIAADNRIAIQPAGTHDAVP